MNQEITGKNQFFRFFRNIFSADRFRLTTKTGKIALAMVLLVLVSGVYFGYRHWSFLNLAPTVVAGNFALEYKKIPYNVPSIDIVFSHDLDATTITANSVKIFPYVQGTPSLKWARTVSYALGGNLEIGKKYLLQLTPDISSARGVRLATEVSYEIEAIGGVEVVKMIPSGETDSLAKNPLFIFNIPVVPLSTLEEREKLPCPVKFVPEVKGRCTWPSGNVLEYRIDGTLDASTEYGVELALTQEFLFPLEKPFSSKFSTTRIRVMTGTLDDSGVQRFSPKEWIPVTFSAPVSKEALIAAVVLKDGNGNVIPHSVVSAFSWTAPSTGYFITGQSGPLPFASDFTLEIAKWLLPSPGNLALEQTATIRARSNAFVLSVNLLKTSWSSTGELLDTNDLTYYGFIPSVNPRFDIVLDEPVDIASLGSSASDTVRLEAKWGSTKYPCELKQPDESVQESEDSTKTVLKPALRRLQCLVRGTLPLGSQYELVFDQKLSAGLKDAVRMPYSSPAEFTIDSVVPVSATEICAYSTNPISYAGSGIIFSPDARVKEVTENQYRPDYSYSGKELQYICPEKKWVVANVVAARLNGNASYSVVFNTDLKDIYGNSLKTRYVRDAFTTPPLRKQDEYLYFMPEKDTQVIPLDAPIVLPVQSINLSALNIQACLLSAEGYSNYLNQRWKEGYTPSCLSTVKKRIQLKNAGWNLTTARIDLAADVFWGELPGNIILVQASADDSWSHNWPEQRDFRVVYLRTNLSLMMERTGTGAVFFATDLDGKEIPKDLEFQAYGCDSGVLGPIPPIRFNSGKSVYEWNLPGSTSADCFRVITASSSSGKYWVVTPWTDGVSDYDFGQFWWADTSDREYAYLHTDRPIYRAGDTVYFQGILRTFAPTGYVKSSAKRVRIRILNNESALFKEVEADVDEHSNFRGEFALVPEMKTGRYYFEILARNNVSKSGLNNVGKNGLPTISLEDRVSDYYVVNDGNFYVEQYSKPTFKTEVAGWGRHLLPGDTIESTATATYYFGWRVANAPVEWTVLAQDYYFDPKEYSEYRFGTDSGFVQCRYWGVCSTSDEYLGTFKRTLDSSGTSRMGYTAELRKLETPEEGKHTGTPDAPKERLITMVAEVTDPNTGKTVTWTDSHIVHVTDGYVGITSPYWIEKDGSIPVEGVVLDTDSKPKSADVKLELIRVEWNSVKKLGVDGVFYNDYELVESLEDTEEVSSSKDGRFKVSLKPKNGGEYKIRASYSGKNGIAYVSDSYSYVSTDSYRVWNTGNNSVTDLTAEKTLMKPGETAVFTLKSPVAKGKIFYSVEKDDRILMSKVIDITGYAQKIEIPVDVSYIPNVYVRAYIIGRDDSKGLPVFKRALSQIRVLPDSKKLSVEVTAEKPSYLPGETLKVKVSVKDAEGKPVNGAVGALSVVDESVLALLGNPEKNPFAFFYEMKRYLGTRVSISLMNLVEKIEIKNVAQGEKWGAGEGNKWWDTKKKRGIFKDTAFWTGKFQTDVEGNAVIDTGALPDNLTTWKIEAVISTDDTKIGVGRASITTEQKVMIQENFPRFLRTSDTMDFAPVVFNRTGKRGRFIVEMAATGATVSNARQEVALDSGESRPILFQVIPNQLSPEQIQAPVEISVSAIAESGESDAMVRTLTAYKGEIYETTAYIGVASGNSVDERLNLSDIWTNASLTLKTSPTLLGNVLSGLEHMLVYPYGCIEQVTSAIIPHIAVKRMHDAVGMPYDLKTKTVRYYDTTLRSWQERTISDMLSDYVVRVMGYRLSSGGFGYWHTDVEYADFALTAYVMDTLADIRDLSIPIDQSLTKGAMDYLKVRLEKGVYEGCKVYDGSESACRYPTREKLQAIAALSRWSDDGIYAFKALRNVDATKDTLADRIERLRIMSILLGKSGVPQAEKDALRSAAKENLDYVLKNYLVYDPRGAYLAPESGYSRTLATAGFIRVLALLGEDVEANRQIADNMTRFLVRMKQADGGYGSTLDTAAVLRAFADRTSQDSQIRNTSFDARVLLNGEEVYQAQFWAQNLLSSMTTDVSLKDRSWVSAMNISTNGVGRLYYDLALRYPVTADKVVARDEWFFVETEWYDYLEYQKIEEAKVLEFDEYLAGKKRYSELAYPKEVREYVKPLSQVKVGQLVRVEYRVILSEARDKVAFESFIPSGSELINTRLSTDTKRVKKNTFFDREDLFDDRYFGYAEVLEPGEYSGSYAIRFTHAGEFSVPPSRIFEFYTPEVFGQTKWNMIEVIK